MTNDSDVIVISPEKSLVSGKRKCKLSPRREEFSLDNSWESSEDLPLVNPYTGLRTDYPPKSTSGWDSPSTGPGQLKQTIQNLDFPTLSNGISSELFYTSTNRGVLWTSSSRSNSAPSSQPSPSTSKKNFCKLFDSMPRQSSPSSQVETTVSPGVISLEGSSLNLCPEISSESDSDVEIIKIEKPYCERSPVKLSSSGGDTDYDVRITGTSYIDPIKGRKKTKRKKGRTRKRKM